MAQFVPAFRPDTGFDQLQIGLLGHAAVLDCEGFVSQVRRDRGQDGLDRPGALHVGMVIVIAGQRQQIHQALANRQQGRGEVGKRLGQVLQTTALETLVVDKDGAVFAQRGDEALGIGAARVLTGLAEVFRMLQLARLSLDMAGPRRSTWKSRGRTQDERGQPKAKSVANFLLLKSDGSISGFAKNGDTIVDISGE